MRLDLELLNSLNWCEIFLCRNTVVNQVASCKHTPTTKHSLFTSLYCYFGSAKHNFVHNAIPGTFPEHVRFQCHHGQSRGQTCNHHWPLYQGVYVGMCVSMHVSQIFHLIVPWLPVCISQLFSGL